LRAFRAKGMNPALTASETLNASEKRLARLNEELSQVLAVLEGSDDTPTTQAVAAVRQVETALRVQLAQWKQIQLAKN